MKASAVSAAGAALAEEARAAEWAARGISPVRTEKPARLNERNSCP